MTTHLRNLHLKVMLLGAAVASGQAVADPFDSPVQDFQPALQLSNGQSLSIHPFKETGFQLQSNYRALELLRQGITDFDTAIRNVIQQLAPSTLVKVDSAKSGKGTANPWGESRDFRFSVNDVDICGYHVRAHMIHSGDTPMILGDVPQVSEHAALTSAEDWPRLQQTLNQSLEALSDFVLDTAEHQLIAQKPCYMVVQGDLIPSWKLNIAAASAAFQITADEYHVFKLEPAYFSASGSAQIYASNPTDGTTTTVTINDLDSSNKLSSSKMYTNTNSSLSGVTEALETDRQYIYTPIEYAPELGQNERNNFDEVSVFTHAQKTEAWYQSIGYSDYTGQRMELSVHARPGDQINNAMYFPAIGVTTHPRIELGDGDGEVLINLPKDRDVIAHEFGHHVIFETLTSTTGESLVLHEGLADYLTFANHGDACLGESICPLNSPMGCEVAGQCLRTGDNDYTLQTAPTGAHFKSQFISGWLWKLQDSNTIPASELNTLVYSAIGKLTPNSGYRNFVLGLMHASRELFNSQHSQAIYQSAQDAGLSDYMSDYTYDAKSYPAIVDPLQTTTTTVKKKSSGFWGCGIAGTHQGMSFLWLWLAVPLLSTIRRKRHKSR